MASETPTTNLGNLKVKTPPATLDSSASTILGGSDISSPRTVKPSRKSGGLKKKLAKGLAALYDDDDAAPGRNNDLASPIFHNHSTSDSRGTQESGMDSGNSPKHPEHGTASTSCDPDSLENAIDLSKIRKEWLGTTQFSLEDRLQIQTSGNLDGLIAYRRSLVETCNLQPYHPATWIQLCDCDLTLGFSDIATASAYKALLLVQAGLRISGQPEYPANLAQLVRNVVSSRMGTTYRHRLLISDELQHLHVNAYRGLLCGLLGCGAFWDGLKFAKVALALFPDDVELLQTNAYLKDGFDSRTAFLKEGGLRGHALVSLRRCGKIFQQKYGWMDPKLFRRTPELVREVNKYFVVGNCEVRPCVFETTKDLPAEDKSPRAKDDVGPLGVFATRDIEEGEIMLVDKTVNTTSDIPSNKLKACDACQAVLAFPFVAKDEVVQPTCCKDVAFCSESCHDTAVKGYHSVLCGQDWSWLYNNNSGPKGAHNAGHDWPPRLLLRMMAVVLTDTDPQHKNIHPLQHPLFAGMTANYVAPNELEPGATHDWKFFSNVLAPIRMLMQLSIDPFSTQHWTPEVLQTMMWRIDNNANMSESNFFKANSVSGTKAAEIKTTLVSINPSYLFLNHSCLPNTTWRGTPPDDTADLSSLVGMNGEIMQPGSSTVICHAITSIKKGEECKISYIGDPTGEQGKSGTRDDKKFRLTKWFTGGCGYELCTKEAEEEKQPTVVEAEKDALVELEKEGVLNEGKSG